MASTELDYHGALSVLQGLLGEQITVAIAHESALRGDLDQAPIAGLGGVLHRAQASWQGAWCRRDDEVAFLVGGDPTKESDVTYFVLDPGRFRHAQRSEHDLSIVMGELAIVIAWSGEAV